MKHEILLRAEETGIMKKLSDGDWKLHKNSFHCRNFGLRFQ